MKFLSSKRGPHPERILFHTKEICNRRKQNCCIRGRFEVPAAGNTKITVFRDVTPCSLVDKYQHVVPFRWKQQVSPKVLNLYGSQMIVVVFTPYGNSCEMGVSIKKVCKCVHSVLPLAQIPAWFSYIRLVITGYKMVIITVYMRDTEYSLHSSEAQGREAQTDIHEITGNLPYMKFEML